nr:type II toxin-antitoxin system PemK/MazF family toxin [Streptomyces sp. HNM0574]
MWWLALGAVVVLALVAALIDGRGRLGPRRPSARVRRRSPAGLAPGAGPLPGEIWWAEVPYEDGPGSKDRPCLVLSVGRDGARVAKITSRRAEDERPGVLALPPGAVDDARGRQSFLETDELRQVSLRGFRRRAGEVDAELWDRVRELTEG